MSISVSHLTKVYGQQKAVNNISFTVNKGEVVGFLGPNGAGKSTTMKIITGYMPPDEGEATVCGINVLQHPLQSKKKIGYLPESNALYTDMYVKEYLSFTGSIYKIPLIKQRVEAVIETVGLTPECKKKIGQLSKGYKQRVGLAAALIHDPEVLILDEPTSGLDPNQIVEIREVIRQLGKQKTVLFSTHIMQEVEAVCDRVIIINKGNIVADDLLSTLVNGTVASLRVTFKEPLEAAWLERLPSIETVSKLDAYTWQVQGSDMIKSRKQIMQMAIDNNLNIASIQEGGNLESIFRSLTVG
ncbi:MAG: gliding motility-associated ABC transporter ATP-binding subunit GldA [Bacteroidota bacterium]